jgi:hypothetical protein
MIGFRKTTEVTEGGGGLIGTSSANLLLASVTAVVRFFVI